MQESAAKDGGQRILVVEDSLSVAKLMKASLDAVDGFTADNAYTLAQALDILASDQDYFLAVLDLHLPDASGAEIVNAVQAHGVPVIVYTSDFSRDLRENILGKGIIDYVIKSGNTIVALVAMIERLWRNTGIKVLVVDDSRQFRKYLRRLLERQMLTVFEASSGEEALTLLESEPDISLVFTDYEMKGINGAMLASRIRDRYAWGEKAVIGLSSEQGDTSVRFIKSGAHDFLPKTFEYEELYWRTRQNLETLEQVRELRRLNELKNRFMGMAAHDLRNPIGSIKGYSRLLEQGVVGEVNAEQKNFLSSIYNTSSHMLDLVNDLLDVSILESGGVDLELVPVDLVAIAQEQITLHRVMAESKNIRIDFESPSHLECTADGNRLSQVVSNLLSNAVKYSPAGSRVTVTLTMEQGKAVICVKDEGPGISPDERGKLFKPFQRLSTKPTAGEKSTGLGLSIVHDIIRAHGGEVWVRSEPGRGSAFYASLPSEVFD